MKTAPNSHFDRSQDDSSIKNLFHYLLIIMFYVGLFFLVSFISKAMPGGTVSSKTEMMSKSASAK